MHQPQAQPINVGIGSLPFSTLWTSLLPETRREAPPQPIGSEQPQPQPQPLSHVRTEAKSSTPPRPEQPPDTDQYMDSFPCVTLGGDTKHQNQNCKSAEKVIVDHSKYCMQYRIPDDTIHTISFWLYPAVLLILIKGGKRMITRCQNFFPTSKIEQRPQDLKVISTECLELNCRAQPERATVSPWYRCFQKSNN